MLWHNDGPGDFGLVEFADVAAQAGVWDGGWAWGAKFFDADLDGDLDLLSLNGFISDGDGDYWYDLASWTVLGLDPAEARNWPPISGRSFSGYEMKRFWRAEGPMVFREMAREAGIESTRDGRGLVCFDYDNDGDLDLYFANQGQPPDLYRNEVTGRHWLEVRLLASPASRTNRDAVGARVTLVTGGSRQIRERDGGNGYCGQSDPRLHFGLGNEATIRFCEVRWPDGGYQVVQEPPIDRVIEIRQDSTRYSAEPAIAVALPTRMRKAALPNATVATSDTTRIMGELASMEAKLARSLDSYALSGAYRRLCATHNLHDRSIEFFEEMVRKDPQAVRPRIELSLAYVDKIPTCGGIAAIVSKGTLARRSLDQLDHVIEKLGDSWVARYCRATNHLYWPRALRHSDDAVTDFLRCIAIQESTANKSGSAYFVRTHVALGDAYAKGGRYDEARAAWRAGLDRFPESDELHERIRERSDAELLKFIEARRNLEEPIDTNLSFLDPGRGNEPLP
jgi:hypothetical protein